MSKDFKFGDEVWVKGVINSEIRNSGVHVLHSATDAFYPLELVERFSPTVSKEHAKLFEDFKSTLDRYLTSAQTFNSIGIELPEGMSIQKLVNMYQFGYEIEKEKLYTAESKLTGDCLLWDAEAGRYEFCDIEYGDFEKVFTKGHLQSIDIWENPAFEIKEAEE